MRRAGRPRLVGERRSIRLRRKKRSGFARGLISRRIGPVSMDKIPKVLGKMLQLSEIVRHLSEISPPVQFIAIRLGISGQRQEMAGESTTRISKTVNLGKCSQRALWRGRRSYLKLNNVLT